MCVCVACLWRFFPRATVKRHTKKNLRQVRLQSGVVTLVSPRPLPLSVPLDRPPDAAQNAAAGRTQSTRGGGGGVSQRASCGAARLTATRCGSN